MRRVVTGVDDDGRSTVVSDGHAPAMFVTGGEDSPFGLVRTEGAACSPAGGAAAVSELWALGTDPGVVTDDPTATVKQFVVDHSRQ